MNKNQTGKWIWLSIILIANVVMLFVMFNHHKEDLKSNGSFEAIFTEITATAKEKVAKATDVTKGLFNSDERAAQIAKNKAKLSKQIVTVKKELKKVKKVVVSKKADKAQHTHPHTKLKTKEVN